MDSVLKTKFDKRALGKKISKQNQHRFIATQLLKQQTPTTLTYSTQPTHHYHCNAQGSVGALTDSSQNISYYVEYDSFGEPKFLDSAKQEIDEELLGNPMLFQGRRLDDETGFYYYRNRYLNPKMDRFITRDWQCVYGVLEIGKAPLSEPSYQNHLNILPL